MPREITVEGVLHVFPDEATDADISDALNGYTRSQSMPVQGMQTQPGGGVTYDQWPTELAPPPPGVAATTPSGWPSPDPAADRRARGIPDTPPGGDARRSFQIGAQGVGRGIADLVGGLPDLTNTGANLLLSLAEKISPPRPTLSGLITGEPPPFRFRTDLSQRIADAAGDISTRAGVPPIEQKDMTPTERGGYAAERSGTSAGLGAGALAAASLARSAGATLGPLAEFFTSTFGKPYQKSAAPVVGDVAGGAGAGVAGHAYDEYAPKEMQESWFGPIGATLANLAGGVGGASLLTGADLLRRGATSVGKNILTGDIAKDLPPGVVNPATGQPYTNADVTLAAKTAQSFASNPRDASATTGETRDRLLYKDIDESDPTRNLLPPVSEGSLPTTGLMSGDVGLAASENAARASGNAPRFIIQDQRVREQALDLANRVAPQGAEGRDFTDPMNRLQEGRVDTAQRQLDQATGQQTGVNMSREQSGADLAANQGQKVPASQALDTVVRRDVMGVQDRTNLAFDQIDPGRVVMRDPIPLINRAEAIQGQQGPLNDPANVPPVVNRIAGLRPTEEAAAAGAVPADISFGDMQSIRPELNEAINQARRAGNYTAADRLREIRTVINEEVDRLAAEGGPAADRAREALRIYREELAPVWNVGPKDPATQYRKDLNLDRFGTSTTEPSQTANRFLQKNRPEKADSLQRIIDASPTPDEARAASRQFLISDLAESGVLQGGVIRPDALRRWRDNWGTAIDVAPDFRDEVTTMLARANRGERISGRLADEVAAAQRNLGDVTQNTGALRLVLGKDPVHAVEAIFTSGDPERNMAEVLSRVGTNTRARDGLKAALRDYILERKTTSGVQGTTSRRNPVSFDQLDKLFKQHENVLTQILRPEEMNSLRGAHAFLKPLVDKGIQATTGSQTAERAGQFWKTAEIGLKARYGILKGGGILRTLRLWADTLPSNDAAVKQLVEEMYFNPELAQHLLTKNVSQVGSKAWNAKLNALLSSPAAGVREANEPQEQPQ